MNTRAYIFIISLLLVCIVYLITIKDLREMITLGNSFILEPVIPGEVVHASGTWKGVNQKIAYPLNISEIECVKNTMECTEVRAYIAETNKSRGALCVSQVKWDIDKWSESTLTINEESRCSLTRIIIDLENQSVTQIRQPHEKKPLGCPSIKEGIFIVELVDGMKVFTSK